MAAPFFMKQERRTRKPCRPKRKCMRRWPEQVAAKLTDSWQEWTGFLTTAARLYKYTFQDQMMIYAQRPDATRLCRVRSLE